MKITLIGSGTRANVIANFDGVFSWIRLPLYKDFLLSHITNKSVVVGRMAFMNPGFRELLIEAKAKITVLGKEIQEKDPDIRVSRKLEIALASASDSHDEVFVVGGAHLFEQTIKRAHVIWYMQADMDIREGFSFPKIEPQIFHKASTMSLREDLPQPVQIEGRRLIKKPQSSIVVPVQIQHWLKRKTKP
jgi:dihydrofolate reductase